MNEREEHVSLEGVATATGLLRKIWDDIKYILQEVGIQNTNDVRKRLFSAVTDIHKNYISILTKAALSLPRLYTDDDSDIPYWKFSGDDKKFPAGSQELEHRISELRLELQNLRDEYKTERLIVRQEAHFFLEKTEQSESAKFFTAVVLYLIDPKELLIGPEGALDIKVRMIGNDLRGSVRTSTEFLSNLTSSAKVEYVREAIEETSCELKDAFARISAYYHMLEG